MGSGIAHSFGVSRGAGVRFWTPTFMAGAAAIPRYGVAAIPCYGAAVLPSLTMGPLPSLAMGLLCCHPCAAIPRYGAAAVPRYGAAVLPSLAMGPLCCHPSLWGRCAAIPRYGAAVLPSLAMGPLCCHPSLWGRPTAAAGRCRPAVQLSTAFLARLRLLKGGPGPTGLLVALGGDPDREHPAPDPSAPHGWSPNPPELQPWVRSAARPMGERGATVRLHLNAEPRPAFLPWLLLGSCC